MRMPVIALLFAVPAASLAADRQLLWGDTHLHTSYSSDAYTTNNLTADPDVTIQVGPDVMPARASTLEGADRERLWGVLTGIWPDYDQYQAKTDRVIPLVALDPAA